MPPSCSIAVGLKASALQQVLPIVQRVRVDVYFGDGMGDVLNRLSRSLLKVLCCAVYMPSTTPLAWHRRAVSSEGCNTNVQPIVRSCTFRVSPLPPLSLFNMVMETAVRRETNFFISSNPRPSNLAQIAIKYVGACARALASFPLRRVKTLRVGQKAPRLPCKQHRFQTIFL